MFGAGVLFGIGIACCQKSNYRSCTRYESYQCGSRGYNSNPCPPRSYQNYNMCSPSCNNCSCSSQRY